ncbi:MAG TPA: HAMP domain-containing sensor histidine kinase [Pilimelia sp.]|nr:HAMP domain-containing sensor histidine kinase [Pilimelia sp.]
MKRLTIRARLTLLYGGLFMLAGTVLLALTYALVGARLPRRFVDRLPPEAITQLPLAGRDGQRIPPEQMERVLVRIQGDVRDSALESLLTQGTVALLVVGAVAIGFGWLLTGRALQPLHQITETAGRIAGAGTAGKALHERLAFEGPQDEVRRLADTFDTMLERLDRSFDGQRRFVANASHELRTPLAINRALLELAVTRPGAPAELRQLGESLLAVNERHERLIDGLLTLADSENDLTEHEPVDLADVAGPVTDQLAAAAGAANVTVRRELSATPTTGDPLLLERVVHNLVENAVKHNVPADGWLWIRTTQVGGRATVTVANTGPAIPRYEVESLFQPFRRLGGARLSGAGRGFGLGLSIVRAVARTHGGEATADPREGGGLIVTVSLPGAAPAPAPWPMTAPALRGEA